MTALLDHGASIAAIAGVFFLAVAVPGPNFVAVTHHAVARSRLHGLAVVLGVAVGTTLWILACVLGLGLLLDQAPWLRLALQLVGSAYLVWTGIRLLLCAGAPLPEPAATPASAFPLDALRTGLLVNLSNPKSAAFYTSLFVVMLPADPPLALQLALPAILVPISVLWYGLVALTFSAPAVARAYRRAKRWIDIATGGLFTALGLRLALER